MKHFYIILIAFLALSCTRKFYVAPKMADCSIGGKTECFLIKSTEDGNWIMIAEDIVGFEFEEGFIYRVVVKKIKLIDDFGTERPAYEIVDVLEKNPYTGKMKSNDEASIKTTPASKFNIMEDSGLDYLYVQKVN